MPQVAQPPQVRPYNGALRLTFEYEGSNVKLVSKQKVEMILPPTQSLTGHENQTGFWFMLSNAQGTPVYRRAVHNPIAYDREIFSNNPEHPSVQRVPVAEPKGTFILLVPDVQEAKTIQLFSHPLNPAGRGLAASEFARFDIASEPDKGEKK